MKRLFLSLLFIATGLNILLASDQTNTLLREKLSIQGYKVVSYYIVAGKQRRAITREIVTDKGMKYYFIDMDTLRYGLTDKLEGTRTEGAPPAESFLGKVLAKQKRDARPYGSAAEFHTGPSNKNIILTTDLCPTKNNYDSQFYSNLASLNLEHGRNVPLIIFFSGLWVKKHRSQLDAIRNSGLDFIAGNHTLKHNILKKEKDNAAGFTAELTNTEAILLENGIMPSYFFRFPGLISDKEHMDVLDEMNLTAIDANVWMGTKARNWGILLVHSNGCASSEVRVFASYTSKNLERLKRGELRFRSIYTYLEKVIFPKEDLSAN